MHGPPNTDPASVFRGDIAAAPLKRIHPRLGRVSGRVFRGDIAAAPLKRAAGDDDRSDIRLGLPRRHRRGPIEASVQNLNTTLRAGDRLPRRHRRGPIEACPRASHDGGHPARVFRGDIAAAPLKQASLDLLKIPVAPLRSSAATSPRPHRSGSTPSHEAALFLSSSAATSPRPHSKHRAAFGTAS